MKSIEFENGSFTCSTLLPRRQRSETYCCRVIESPRNRSGLSSRCRVKASGSNSRRSQMSGFQDHSILFEREMKYLVLVLRYMWATRKRKIAYVFLMSHELVDVWNTGCVRSALISSRHYQFVLWAHERQRCPHKGSLIEGFRCAEVAPWLWLLLAQWRKLIAVQ